jgi:signal transduction histidine kinase
MLYKFLANNRADLIARCIEKVAQRPKRAATQEQLANGIPMFIGQLIRTLEAEQGGEVGAGVGISGPSGGKGSSLTEMGVTATAHGKELLALGYSVDQVVHDYGDLCQAITDLAFERDAPFSVDEYRTLNRCLDNAIADAVTEFSAERDAALEQQHGVEINEQIGFLMHELRNALGTASLAVNALDLGHLTMAGATGAVLRRSLAAMGQLITRSLDEVRFQSGDPPLLQRHSLTAFIADAKLAGDLDAMHQKCRLTVAEVDPLLGIEGNRPHLLGAVMNLLQNAFKFTQQHSEVLLTAYVHGERILIEVQDHCGGLPAGNAEKMFTPFTQRSEDRTGLGLGLTIARKSVEADGGILSVKNMPGEGCIFTIDLPRYSLQ